jgi:colicin import membrane protein
MLALLAHGLLVAVLTIGVQWKREATPVTVEAELWSALPQEAAPPAPLETPEPPIPAEPKPTPKPEPQPVAQPKPVPQPDPSIAIAKEKEKAKLLKEKQLREEKIELEKKRERLDKEKALKDKAEKAEKDKALKDKDTLAKATKDKAAKRAQQEAKDEKALEELRQQNIKRMAGLAGSGGSGAPASTGTAAQSSAPTASYMGRIAARIKPNIVYTETIVGNPKTEIEVRMSPDGTILTSRIVKASGTKSWDDAALKAIDKTGVLPRDENGRVPTPLIIVMSPQELFGR